MHFGITLPTPADAWKTVKRAEELGFSNAWFYDTQMLSADCFVAMGAAAVQTGRIRLGTGVLIPSNRIAPVAAAAFASLNKLAPGRIDFGVGTGFTGRRALGLGAMKLADMDAYIETVQALLREETVEFEMEGKRRKVRFLNPDAGLINTVDPVALHISALGPRGRGLVARRGAGWINLVSDAESGVRDLRAMQESWRAAGRDPADLRATAFILGCVLAEGEPADSDRAMAQAGLRAAVMLHRAADAALMGLPLAGTVLPGWEAATSAYVAWLREQEPKDAPWLANHRGHLIYVKPEERPFITAEMVAASSFAATEAELVRRISSLREAGYSQVTVQLVPGHEDAVEQWARIKDAIA